MAQWMGILAITISIFKSFECAVVEPNLMNCQEVNEKLEVVQTDLKDTKRALTKLITTLLENKDDSYELEAGGEHLIRKRRALSDDSDETPSRLAINSLVGLRGQDGKDGKDGKDGRDGRDGAPAAAGIAGAPGAQGSPGTAGKDGVGTDGAPGRDGRNGAPGESGSPGEKGAAGLPGSTGEKGASGSNGIAGSPGAPGQSGQEGRSGAPGTYSLKGETSGSDRAAKNSGTVYTRWGRTSCGNQSTLLYSGFTGGSRYDQPGGGVNYQCMPIIPEYNSYRSGGSNTYLSGSEYESSTTGIFPNQANNQNVPCARCYTNTRSAVMMLPAKRTCPSGWTREYEGYLMSELNAGKHQTTFECVDASPEYISGSNSNTNGALFYFVKPICSGTGSIGHCHTYVNDRQLTCAVCSK